MKLSRMSLWLGAAAPALLFFLTPVSTLRAAIQQVCPSECTCVFHTHIGDADPVCSTVLKDDVTDPRNGCCNEGFNCFSAPCVFDYEFQATSMPHCFDCEFHFWFQLADGSWHGPQSTTGSVHLEYDDTVMPCGTFLRMLVYDYCPSLDIAGIAVDRTFACLPCLFEG